MDVARETRLPGEEECDVAIVGGGLVGLSLALALAGSGLQVVVVDRDAPADSSADAADGRSSAIAWGSQRVLAAIGVWDLLASDAAVTQPAGDRERRRGATDRGGAT